MHDPATPARAESWTDEELFASIRGERNASTTAIGAQAALGVLFERYHARVLLSCEKILGKGPAAEDAAQDIFLGLLGTKRQYQNRRSFGAWLFVITRNHCLNALRRNRRETDVDPYEAFLGRASSGPDPAQLTADRELGEHIRRACETKLSVMEQRVIDLRLRWELPVKEIDSLLSLDNQSGARTYLSTARRKLRTALADFVDSMDDESPTRNEEER
jgi:RNA polymerase sigma factor (sigma-70 family)